MTGAVVWFTGTPASGKSTLARRVAERLGDERIATLLLDGDEVREALEPPPAYDEAGREHFYVTLGQLACLAAHQGLIVLVAATAHRRRWRDRARAGAPRFVEVHVATPLQECRRRDPKGLYDRADAAATLPGLGVAYEPPLAPDLVAPSGDEPIVADAVLALLAISGR